MSKQKGEWRQIPRTLDFESQGWLAKYNKTIRGFGSYRVFTPSGRLYSIGGLPDFVEVEGGDHGS